jgi:hypothetical protein
MLSVVSSYLGRVVASDSKRGYLCADTLITFVSSKPVRLTTSL